MTLTLILATIIGVMLGSFTHAEGLAPLVLESRIPLGAVNGRIDHLAVDVTRQRLYVAELANNSVGVIDLKAHAVLRTMTGFSEPQGIAYVPTADAVYVANGGDGSVHIFNAPDLTLVDRILLGSDADNIRLDTTLNRVYVGYGSGALAAIDPKTRRKIADFPLKGHPESFQLDAGGSRIFINVPDARAIAVVDRDSGKQITRWPTKSLRANYPLTLDLAARQVWVVFRSPAQLVATSMNTGNVVATLDTCGDADDVFMDTRLHRIYVICGEGAVDVFELQNNAYHRIAQLPTVSGARTGLYVPELDRLFVAIRKTWNEPAAIWVFRPQQ